MQGLVKGVTGFAVVAEQQVDAPAPDTSRAPESRTIGGLDLHLLRTLSDGMSYERRGGFNHVTLVKRLG